MEMFSDLIYFYIFFNHGKCLIVCLSLNFREFPILKKNKVAFHFCAKRVGAGSRLEEQCYEVPDGASLKVGWKFDEFFD